MYHHFHVDTFRVELEKSLKKTHVKPQSKPTTSVDSLFNFEGVPEEHRKEFISYLVDYILRDKKNIVLLKVALSQYYSESHLNNWNSISLLDLYNDNSFWSYFVSNYFIQNEYLKLLMRKFQRRNIKTENDILLNATAGYNPSQYLVESISSEQADQNIINLKHMLFNTTISIEKELNEDISPNTDSNANVSEATRDLFLKTIEKWKKTNNIKPRKLRKLLELLDDMTMRINQKIDYYDELFMTDTLSFMKLFNKLQKKKNLSFHLANTVFRARNHNLSLQEEKSRIEEKLRDSLLHHRDECLELLHHGKQVEHLVKVVVFENIEWKSEAPKQPETAEDIELVQPTISPLLQNFSNEEILDKLKLTTPFIKRRHLQRFIDNMLRDHLKESLRYADPFIDSYK